MKEDLSEIHALMFEYLLYNLYFILIPLKKLLKEIKSFFWTSTVKNSKKFKKCAKGYKTTKRIEIYFEKLANWLIQLKLLIAVYSSNSACNEW